MQTIRFSALQVPRLQIKSVQRSLFINRSGQDAKELVKKMSDQKFFFKRERNFTKHS